MPDITICIRTLNEAAFLENCLAKVYAQKGAPAFEVLIIDSGSTDATVEIAQRFPVRIHHIPAGQFHYAETLNAGVRLANGDLFVPLSAHAIPVNDEWLQSLVDAVDRDALVAGAYSRQIGNGKGDPYEHALMQTLFPPHSLPALDSVNPNDSFAAVFSNASACLRMSVLKKIPFRKIPRCEDRLWASEAIQRGYRIAYAPRSCVTHTHIMTPMDYFVVARLNGIAYEIVDGPINKRFARLIPTEGVARILEWMHGLIQHYGLPKWLLWFVARYGNAIAYQLGLLAGLREGRRMAEQRIGGN